MLAVFLLFISVVTAAQSESGLIQGTLTDQQGSPVEFANIYNLQNGIGVVSDSLGKFSISLPAYDSLEIVISHASFEMQKFKTRLLPGEIQQIDVLMRIREMADFVVEDYRVRTSPMQPIQIRSAKELPMVRPGIEGLLTGAVGVVLRNELSSAYSVR